MNPQAVFLVIGTIMYGGLFAATRLIQSSHRFRQRPADDQERAQKQFKLILWLTPVSMFGAYLLLGAPPQVLKWIPLVSYFSIWGLSIWFFWRTFQLAVRRNHRLVKSSQGKPLRNPELLIRSFALMNLLVAVGLAALAIAIPLYRLPFSSWAAPIAVIMGMYRVAITWQERHAGV